MTYVCDECDRPFETKRGLDTHIGKMHDPLPKQKLATITVLTSGPDWRVERNGRYVSDHRKKKRAVARARREAASGDQLIVQRRDGTISTNNTVR